MGIYVDERQPLAKVVAPRSSPETSTIGEMEFAQLVEPHLVTMLRLARRLGRHDAEDIVQDALARAWTKRNRFDPQRGAFGAWLLAITADQAYKTWRWGSRHNRPLPAMAAGDPRSDEMIDLERSIEHLPGRQRLAVDCYYYAGLSVAETAAVMRCSEGTVKSTLFDARAALRTHLEVTE